MTASDNSQPNFRLMREGGRVAAQHFEIDTDEFAKIENLFGMQAEAAQRGQELQHLMKVVENNFVGMDRRFDRLHDEMTGIMTKGR